MEAQEVAMNVAVPTTEGNMIAFRKGSKMGGKDYNSETGNLAPRD